MSKLCSPKCCDIFSQRQTQQYIQNPQFKKLTFLASSQNPKNSQAKNIPHYQNRTSLKSTNLSRNSKFFANLGNVDERYSDQIVTSNLTPLTESNFSTSYYPYRYSGNFQVMHQTAYNSPVIYENPLVYKQEQIKTITPVLVTRNNNDKQLLYRNNQNNQIKYGYNYQNNKPTINNNPNNLINLRNNINYSNTTLTPIPAIKQSTMKFNKSSGLIQNTVNQNFERNSKNVLPNANINNFGNNFNNIYKNANEKSNNEMNNMNHQNKKELDGNINLTSANSLKLGRSMATIASEIEEEPQHLGQLKLIKKQQSQVLMNFFHPTSSQLQAWSQSKKPSKKEGKYV